MNRYLLVVYDSKEREYYNEIVSSSSKEMAIVNFILSKKDKEVLLNIMDYG